MATVADRHAWLGRKPCGCPVFARLCSVTRGAPLAKVAAGLDVRRVPVDRASVTVCRCES